MNKTKIILLLIALSTTLIACSNKDSEEESEIFARPITTCDGLVAENGHAYVDGDSLHVSATVTAARKISTYRLHGPTRVVDSELPVEVYELRGFFGQEFEEEEYVSQIDVQMALSNIQVPHEIIITCKQGETALIRIPLDNFKN